MLEIQTKQRKQIKQIKNELDAQDEINLVLGQQIEALKARYDREKYWDIPGSGYSKCSEPLKPPPWADKLETDTV